MFIFLIIFFSNKNKQKRKKIDFKNYTGSIVGIISKMIASSILYPFNLIRSRQQQLNNRFFEKITNEYNDKKYNTPIVENNGKEAKMKSQAEFYRFKTIYTNLNYGNFMNATKTIYRLSGFQGFYKGLSPLLIRQIPGSSAFFYTYEVTLKYLNTIF